MANEQKGINYDVEKSTMIFYKILNFIFPGPRRVRNWKFAIFSFLFSLSIFGIFLHINTLFEHWHENVSIVHEKVHPFREMFEELSLHLFAGLFLFVVLDITFHNVEKWYGETRRFSYTNFTNDINKTKSKDEIIIVNTFLLIFTPDIEGNSKTDFVEKRKKFTNAITDALARKIKVKILLLDPISFAARQRRKEVRGSRADNKNDNNLYAEFNNKFDVMGEIINTINKFGDIPKNDLLEIKLYNRIPPFALFQAGDQCSFTFYPVNGFSNMAPHFHFYRKGVFEEFIKPNFNDIWDDKHGSTCTLEEYFILNINNDKNENYLFVDLYNTATGFIPERKIVAIFCKNKPHEQGFIKNLKLTEIEITYRGNRVKGNLIDEETISNRFDMIYPKEEKLDNYVVELLSDKYPEQYRKNYFGRSVNNQKIFYLEITN